jgi:cell division protease FtsH
VEKEKATAEAQLVPGFDRFGKLAENHRAALRKIRERNRIRRITWIGGFFFLIVLWVAKRGIEGNPIHVGLPNLSAEDAIWIFPAMMVLIIALALLGPMLLNGRSPALRFSPEQLGITFSDVRGLDTVLEEVTRTLQIFLTYKSFKDELGGNPRRGILFEGKPGTGKTHMAKAMAAEAGVPFYFVSAPAFQSMWFGMTAFKIRAFFKDLKKAALKEGGAIGFIEEIDAIGGGRGHVDSSAPYTEGGRSVSRFGSSDTGGMVNELLIQMQSFDTPLLGGRLKNWFIDKVNSLLPPPRQLKKAASPYRNVLIIAATNRADVLDAALMRPGRFDRTLYFDLPSLIGRRQLIDYYLESRAHSSEMDRDDLREELASMTLGYSPAMLQHILDESLVWALREGRRELTWKDVQQARITEEIGVAQPVAYTERERDIIATHEAGHAVAAYLNSHRKLEVLSIIKRRQALGLLAHSDTEERFTRTKSELQGTLKIALAGMAAEIIFFDESGTGPSSDLSAATALAAQMVGSFGMGSSLVSYDAVNNGMHSSPNIVAKVLTNEDAKREVDEILNTHLDEVKIIIDANRDLVEALRDALLEHEELLGDEIMEVIAKAEAGRS